MALAHRLSEWRASTGVPGLGAWGYDQADFAGFIQSPPLKNTPIGLTSQSVEKIIREAW